MLHSSKISYRRLHSSLSSATHIGRHAVCRIGDYRAAAASVELPQTDDGSNLLQKYAVLSIGGIQQLVQEGNWYCCANDAFPQGSSSESSGKVLFDRVLAWKNNGKFLRGHPYLNDVIVEAQVLEEFTAPYACQPSSGDGLPLQPRKQQVVKKYLITKIASQQ